MLETQRLILRKFVPEDGPGLYGYLSDPDVVRYEPYEPKNPEDCQQEAERRAGDEAFWAACLKESGKLIGNLYFARREFDAWEIGYVFHRAYQGKGYAFESARELITYGFKELKVRRIVAMCNPENEKSWRLMERLHMRREGHFLQDVSFRTDDQSNPVWQDTYAYGLLAGEWERTESL